MTRLIPVALERSEDELREELIELARPVQQHGIAWLEATTADGAVRAFEVSFGSYPPAVSELRDDQWERPETPDLSE